MKKRVVAFLIILSTAISISGCSEIDNLLGIDSFENIKSEIGELDTTSQEETQETHEDTEMGKIIYGEISQMKDSFTFTYERKVSPQEVLDEIRRAMQGSYYWGIIGGDINAEVVTRERSDRSEITIKVEYIHTREEEMTLESVSDEIIGAIIEAGMSESDKVKAIYDYVVLNAEYATEGSLTQSGASVHSPYAIIRDGKGVCQAYALLNYKLLEKAGIEVIYITGQASNGDRVENHAWNLVYVNGEWHHSDPTWGDPIPDVRGRVLYDYYMKSDADFSQTHTWDESLYPRASGRF